MAAFIKFNSFILNMGLGLYDLNSDVLEVYLTNVAPNVATNTVKADLADIAHANGYNGPVPINNAYSQSAGVGNMTGVANITTTAAGGTVGPFRYVILFDSTAAGSPLIGYWDYGAPLTLNDTETFTVSFDPDILTIQ